ncbi:MAG: TonB-dependent receptor, partial [Muriicola sp.]|nr:TonB-dependent receptor [Muriicola sp.]
IQLALYQMDINNLLVAQRVGDDEFIGKNAGETKHQGVELAASLLLEIAPTFKITPFVNYTFNDHSFVDFVDGENDFSGNPLPGVPKHRLNTGIQTQLFENFYWNTTHQFVGAMPLTDANSLSSDSFHVFTTKIGYEKNLSDSFSIGINLGVNNLFNVRYAQSVLINTRAFGGAEPRYYYPGNDRNYYSGVRLKYSM